VEAVMGLITTVPEIQAGLQKVKDHEADFLKRSGYRRA
jgi:hypothetical protein